MAAIYETSLAPAAAEDNGISAAQQASEYLTILGQDETDFDGAGSNGTFTAGSGYSAADVITMSDGTVVTVATETAGAVATFDITTATPVGSGGASPNATLTQGSVAPPGGTGFELVLGDANEVATSTGALLINGVLASGGVATLDVARRVAIDSDANDSGITFTITGTNRYGDSITETLTGPNAGAVTSLLDFKTVTEVLPNGVATGELIVGTNAVASSAWFPLNRWLTPANTVFEIDITGTFTAACEFTLEDTATSNGPFTVYTNTLGSVSADAVGNFVMPVSAIRMTSSAIGGSADFRVIQAGV